MASLGRRAGEKRSDFESDPLYAVKSLVKLGFLQVGGAMLKHGDWHLNVRSWEVEKKKLLEFDGCDCMKMSEYRDLMQKAEEPVVVEVTEEVVLEVAEEPELVEPQIQEGAEKPKRKRRKKKGE